MTSFVSILIYLPKLLLGFAIANHYWKEIDIPSILIKLTVGLPIGLALSASAFFIATLLGIEPDKYSKAELIFELILIAVLLPAILGSLRQHWKDIRIPPTILVSSGIVICSFILFTTAFIFYAKMHSHGFEDAWSMWNYVARFIYRTNSVEVLLDSQHYNRNHPDYPVELSFNVAWGWFILKKETFRIPVSLAFLAATTPSVMIWAAMWKWKSILAGTVGAMLVLLTLNLQIAISQYADTLLTIHILPAVILFYGYLKSKNEGLLTLAGLLAGFSAWVKNEGILFAGILITICILAKLRHMIDWNGVKQLIIGAIIPFVILIAYKITVGVQSDLFSGENSFVIQILDFDRWQVIGVSFFDSLINNGGWPVSAIVIFGLHAVLTGRDADEHGKQKWIFLILTGQILGYFGIYLITPHELTWHINTSIERLISHIYPLIIFWIAIAFYPSQQEFNMCAGKTSIPEKI